MRTIGKFMRTTKAEGKVWKAEIERFLSVYRSTPHSATGQTPSEALFGRKMRNRMPDLKQTDEAYKAKLKEYADRKRRTKEHDLRIGDEVYKKKEKKLLNKTEPYFESNPYRVEEIKGDMITVVRGKQCVTRNSSFFKKKVGSGWWDVESDPFEDADEIREADVQPNAEDPVNNAQREQQADVPATADDPAEEGATRTGDPADVPAISADDPAEGPVIAVRKGTRERRPPQKFNEYVTPTIKRK